MGHQPVTGHSYHSHRLVTPGHLSLFQAHWRKTHTDKGRICQLGRDGDLFPQNLIYRDGSSLNCIIRLVALTELSISTWPVGQGGDFKAEAGMCNKSPSEQKQACVTNSPLTHCIRIAALVHVNYTTQPLFSRQKPDFSSWWNPGPDIKLMYSLFWVSRR